MKATTSIQRRLLTYLSSALVTLWIVITIGSSIASIKEINEMADSQMLQLASTIKHVAPQVQNYTTFKSIEEILPHNEGYAETGNQGFAVWNQQGKLLFADRKGQNFPFSQQIGFHNDDHFWDLSGWRYVYLVDPERVVAVGQKLDERFDMLFDALWVQLVLLLCSIPVLLLLIIYGIRRGLSPLKQVTQEIQARDVRSLKTVSENVPAEIVPLVNAINHLLNRLDQAIQKERRFTSDAAHELRSPLAALKVQAEVLAMTEDKEEQLQRLRNIHMSIDRASHLVDQLLTLSRLDPLQALPDNQPIDWNTLIPQTLQSVNLAARQKHIKLKLVTQCTLEDVLPLYGTPLLIQTMLRNVLDNAIRYSPEQSVVTLTLSHNSITVQDQGPGIAPEDMKRIRERFYRPAGQTQQGSGLGFSIIETIAELHGLQLCLSNAQPTGLIVVLRRTTP